MGVGLVGGAVDMAEVFPIAGCAVNFIQGQDHYIRPHKFQPNRHHTTQKKTTFHPISLLPFD